MKATVLEKVSLFAFKIIKLIFVTLIKISVNRVQQQ